MTRHTSFWRIFIMLMLICMTMVAVAQTAETGKLSAFVRHALRECLREQHATRSDNDQRIPQHITAFVKVNDGSSLLQKYGCQTYAQWGDIHIARIPLSNLEALSAERYTISEALIPRSPSDWVPIWIYISEECRICVRQILDKIVKGIYKRRKKSVNIA